MTPNEPHLAIIGGTPLQLSKAKAAGLRVTWITQPGNVDPSAGQHCHEVHLIDFQDLEVLIPLGRDLHARAPLRRVVALTETGLLPAALVSDDLGLPGNGLAVVRLLSDKLAMRRHLARCGVSPVAAKLGRSEADLLDFVSAFGPAVVKPRGGAGSLGIRAVKRLADVRDTWQWLTSFGLIPFLMEERLRGPEVSVETLTEDGRHEVIAVTGKQIGPGFVEVGHVVPAPLGADDRRATAAMVVAVLDAVGLREGPAHTEVVVTAGGPRLVESHNRRGGDRIVDLVHAVTGVDIDASAFRMYAGGERPTPDEPLVPAAAVRFLTPPPGQIQQVTGLDRAAAHPQALAVDVQVAPGDVVHPLRWSNDRAGLVIAAGDGPADAYRNADAMLAMVEIRTTELAPQTHVRLDALVEHAELFLNGSIAPAGEARAARSKAAGPNPPPPPPSVPAPLP